MSNFNDFSWYKEKKDIIVDLLRKSSGIIEDISLDQYAEALRQLERKVGNDTFRIQIVGTFKNGKSTFINALLGEDILPSKALPCTAVINEIKYGETKRAVLNFRNPLPERLLSDIPAPTLEHMKAHGMKDVPPMDIEYDRMEDYVTIPVDGDQDEISLKSPYLSVELYYPSPFLKEGVEIVDSPGLNENDERSAVTFSYLDKADAIIFLLDATRACAQDEMDTIESILLPKGFSDMFFAVNRFDLIRPKEKNEVRKFVEDKVRKYTTNEIFCLSALQALDGKIDNDQELLEESGFMPFEKRLAEFLDKDKGKIKLAKPARELKHILANEALFKSIPSQRAQLNTNLQLLRARYEAIQPQLVQYESQKENLKRDLALKVERKENNIARAIATQFREIANLIPAWIEEFEPKTDPGLFAKRRQLDKIADEITAYVSEKIKNVFNTWNQEVLIPLVEESANEIFESTDDMVKGILNGIDSLQDQISGTQKPQDTSSGWVRAFGVAGMCCGFYAGASMLTGHFDFKEVAKSLAVQVGVSSGLLLLGLANPILGIAATAGVIWDAINRGGKVAVRRVKSDLTPVIRNSVYESAPEKASEIVAKIDKEFQQSISTAVKAIDMKIDDLKSQVAAVIEEKEKGQEYADRRLAMLDSSEKELQHICNELDAFVMSLVEGK